MEELPRTTVSKPLTREGKFIPSVICNARRVPRTITEGNGDGQHWRNNYGNIPASHNTTGRTLKTRNGRASQYENREETDKKRGPPRVGNLYCNNGGGLPITKRLARKETSTASIHNSGRVQRTETEVDAEYNNTGRAPNGKTN